MWYKISKEVTFIKQEPYNGINPSKKITGESRVLLMSKASLEPLADDVREMEFSLEDMGLDDLDALLS